MVDLIDLKNWKKQKDIILELHREYGINISSREWRIQVEKWNKKWAEGKKDFCITHSNLYGYKATTSFEEAMIAINDFRSRRRKMYQREKDIIQGFQNRNQCQLHLGTDNVI